MCQEMGAEIRETPLIALYIATISKFSCAGEIYISRFEIIHALHITIRVDIRSEFKDSEGKIKKVSEARGNTRKAYSHKKIIQSSKPTSSIDII